jgi:hypothetical protein
MKNLYRLFIRGSTWYCVNSETGKQESLRTKDREEAQKLCQAKNDALKNPMLNLALGRAYLAAHNPKLVTRTWQDVMDEAARIGNADSSLLRKAKAVKSKAMDLIRNKRLSQTTSDDIFAVIKAGGNYDNRFLRYLHNFAVKAGWLAWPILPPKAWPPVKTKSKRGITREEHEQILKVEPIQEWRSYLELLWEIGSAQTDASLLTADCIDWTNKTIAYQRKKLGNGSEPAVMAIGSRLEKLLKSLPDSGPLFPRIAQMTEKSRAVHFAKRCRAAQLVDEEGMPVVTLHCYRYAWSERGATAGYPERWAKAALGHKSSVVHHGYAKKAKVVCPSLEEYEIRLKKAS